MFLLTVLLQIFIHPTLPCQASQQQSEYKTTKDSMFEMASFQVAIKNNVDVFYFSCVVSMHVLFVEDGEMDKRVFLATWKDIAASNEVQYEIKDVQHNAGEQIQINLTVGT